jgi:hypothetical protein
LAAKLAAATPGCLPIHGLDTLVVTGAQALPLATVVCLLWLTQCGWSANPPPLLMWVGGTGSLWLVAGQVSFWL